MRDCGARAFERPILLAGHLKAGDSCRKHGIGQGLPRGGVTHDGFMRQRLIALEALAR
jgi:hypothetical protein